MADTPSAVRQRKNKKANGQVDSVPGTPSPSAAAHSFPSDIQSPVSKSEWDYKLALVLVTIGGFLTRFYGISHPDQVVFDEVHFGKVRFGNSNFKKGD